MSVREQLEAARADLADLESDTVTLEANVAQQQAELERLRREARAGRAGFGQVVEQQTRADAARGMLQQHLEDLAQQHSLVTELEGALSAEDDLAVGKTAREVMRDAEARFAALAQETEAHVNAALAELAQLKHAHTRARARLQGALQRTVKREHATADFGKLYGAERPHTPTAAHRTGLAFLSEIEAGLTDEVMSPFAPSLSVRKYPHLDALTGSTGELPNRTGGERGEPEPA